MERNDYYKILELDKNSTHEQIKKNYRKLSMKYHPDKNNGKDEMFKKINEAYQTLGDKSKKQEYDNYNNSGINQNNINNIFKEVFGRGSGFSTFNGNNPNIQIFRNGVRVNLDETLKKPPPIIKNIKITLKQSFLGTTIPLKIERWVLIDNEKKIEKETIYVPLPKGIDTNEILIMKNKGNKLSENNCSDLKLIINIINDTEFVRDGLNLIIRKTLSLKDALCGFNFNIVHLNGNTYNINNNGKFIVKPNFVKELNNLGFSRNRHTGKLIIIFDVTFPDKYSHEQIKKLKEII